MAESFKMTKDGLEGLQEAVAVFPTLNGRVNRGTGKMTIFDAKAGERVEVQKGQYIVSIADRFEVADEEPARAHPVTPEPEEKPKAEDKPKAQEKPVQTKAEPKAEDK